MPWKENQPRLMEYFASIPIEKVVRKKLFGKRYITIFNYAATLSFQYETGALLGHVMRDKLDTLHKILVKPGTDINRSIASIQSQAQGLLKQFIAERGKEPDTFSELIFEEVLKRMRVPLEPSIDEYHSAKRYLKDLRELGRELALEDYYRIILFYGTDGLGFGGSFPELTVRMCKNAYENNLNINELAEWARSYGMPLPEKPDIIPLREKQILQILAAYTAEFYPELLDPLDLRGHLEAEGIR